MSALYIYIKTSLVAGQVLLEFYLEEILQSLQDICLRKTNDVRKGVWFAVRLALTALLRARGLLYSMQARAGLKHAEQLILSQPSRTLQPAKEVSLASLVWARLCRGCYARQDGSLIVSLLLPSSRGCVGSLFWLVS
jgi:hypothetical protein